MSDPRTQPIARIAATRLPSETTTTGPDGPSARGTELSFRVDAEASRVHVQVIERESKTVVRSFPVLLPGGAAVADGADRRGAMVDAKV